MAEKTQDMHLPSLKVHGEVFEDYRNEAIEFNYICVSLLSAKRQRKDNGIYFPIMLCGVCRAPPPGSPSVRNSLGEGKTHLQ